MFNVLKDNNVPLYWSYEDNNLYPLGSTCGTYNGLLPWNAKGSNNTGSNESFTIDLSSFKHSSCLISVFEQNDLYQVELDYQAIITNLEMDQYTEPLGPPAGTLTSLYREGLHYLPFRVNSITVNIQETTDAYAIGIGVTYDIKWSVLLL
jgi:hypothetical protein